MAPNLILQCLTDFGDGFLFERLCNDIMLLHYGKFSPAGGVHDSGVDGILELDKDDRIYIKRHKNSGIFIFQYSLQENWESKIKDTVRKLKANNIIYSNFVLVSNREVNNTKLMKLKALILSDYGVSIDVYGQEMLRMYIESPKNDHLLHYFSSYIEQLKRFDLESSIFANSSIKEREKRRALVLLNSCVRSKEGNNIREDGSREIIIGCIYGKGKNKTRTIDDILSDLNSTFGDKVISRDKVEIIVKELMSSGRIRKVDQGFRLSDTEMNRVENKITKLYNDDSMFYLTILNEIKNHYKVDLIGFDDKIRFAIAKTLGKLFEQKGIEISKLFLDSDSSISINEYPEIGIISNDIISDFEDNQLRQAIDTTIKRLFSSPTEFESEYLYGIAESFLVYASLNIDPNVRLLSIEKVSQNFIFLDTDIIMQILIGNLAYGDFYKKIIEITRSLDINMYTFDYVIQEFIYKIQKSDNDYKSMGMPKNISSDIAIKLGDIYQTYFETDINQNQTWNQYITGLYGSSSDKHNRYNFVKRKLENDFGIKIQSFPEESTITQADIRDLADEIIQARGAVYKHDNLYVRDAKAVLLIKRLRENNTDRNFWLISNDTFIGKAWLRKFNSRSPVIVPHAWFQYIIQFPNKNVRPTDFSLLMNSLSLSPIRPKTERHLLMVLIRHGVNISQFTTDALEKLSRRLEVSHLWESLSIVNDEDNVNEATIILGNQLTQILHSLEEEKTLSLSNLQARIDQETQKNMLRSQQIEDLNLENQQLRKRLNLEQSKDRRRERFKKKQKLQNKKNI